ncbi:MAG: hypothetical protein JW741_06835 [Sedimentisphaerales bacterium]|nr:hypothetical protein [Sedimentisphaerales bacterium]
MIFSVPYEREGRTYATVTYAAHRSNDCDVRLIALDVNNVEHRSPSEHVSGLWTSAGFKQVTLDFDLPLDDVAAFNLQTRPYMCVQFNNVSLCAGKIQKMEIITTEPHRTDDNEERNESKVDTDVARDKSARVLRAFHAACVRYLKENVGAELPKRPWLLKFPLEDSVCVSPLQYVTSAGYFRTDGFPSLRREDFESSEASRTPILYCKSLLGREDGKGTNVLFGDGHIQWVTAEELEKLKKSVTPSQE